VIVSAEWGNVIDSASLEGSMLKDKVFGKHFSIEQAPALLNKLLASEIIFVAW